MEDKILFGAILTAGVVAGLFVPKTSRKGVVVFDIDNTVLCHGALMGNSQCNHAPYSYSYTYNGQTYPPWPCTDQEYTYWDWDARHAFSPHYDGTCLKPELGDGRDLDCYTHNQNALPPDPNNCSSAFTSDYTLPGLDCGARDRAKNLIQTLRNQGYGVAINTARFWTNVKDAIPYLKYIGFTADELQSVEDGGVIVYNKTQSYEYITQAKQKAIGMIALAEKFQVPRHKLILVDDQLINCKAVRDFGFQAYNVSTTFGQMWGWSQDAVTPGQPKDGSTECGITDKQADEILKMLADG